MKNNISDIRNEYSKASLDEKDIGDSPIDFFKTWFDQAVHSEVLEPTAMTLATVRKDGMPDARIVLLKGIENEGFQFYTNYTSAKGKELESNPNACLVFFGQNWKDRSGSEERSPRFPEKIQKTIFIPDLSQAK